MELFAMVDYVNPGILGTEKQFKKIYEDPIVSSREAGCEDKELGKERSREVTSEFLKIYLVSAYENDWEIHSSPNFSDK